MAEAYGMWRGKAGDVAGKAVGAKMSRTINALLKGLAFIRQAMGSSRGFQQGSEMSTFVF